MAQSWPDAQAQDQPRGVHVAGRGDGRIDQAFGPGEDLDRRPRPAASAAMSKSWMVKSRKRPPLVGMKPGGGGAGSWLIDVQRLQRADLAGVEPRLQRAGSADRSAVEGDEERLGRPLAARRRAPAAARGRGRAASRRTPPCRPRSAASARSRWVSVEVAIDARRRSAGSARTPVQARRPRSRARRPARRPPRRAARPARRGRAAGWRRRCAPCTCAHAPGAEQRDLRRAAHAAAAVRRPCAYGLMGSC